MKHKLLITGLFKNYLVFSLINGISFGFRFVFGDMFRGMGEMFQELERSMRDMESFFESN